jgi:L-ascorbate metabolism protein UlaG (beta-lactamase superfamily)
MPPEEIVKNIQFLGHASLKIKLEGKTIFVDPWKIKEEKDKADIILVTHPHYDHYSEIDIKKIAKDTTILLSCKEVVSQTSVKNKRVLLPFEETKIDDITVQGFPAYNINKPFHPKSNNWLGFVIKHKNVSIYIAGDSDVTEEAKQLKVNIMILPVGGTYTMTDKEAAELVNLTKPDLAIPIHYGDIVGSIQNAENFGKLVKPQTKVCILKV